jgi:hypothetical protein
MNSIVLSHFFPYIFVSMTDIPCLVSWMCVQEIGRYSCEPFVMYTEFDETYNVEKNTD